MKVERNCWNCGYVFHVNLTTRKLTTAKCPRCGIEIQTKLHELELKKEK